eukprot:tig00001542_g9323.t1
MANASPARAQAPSMVRARILSLNTFMRPPGITNYGDDFKDERCELLCKIISDFDIVCFQECFDTGSSRQQKIIDAGAKAGLKYYVRGPSPLMVPVDSGLVILSRFKILKTDTIVFPRGTVKGGDAFAAKGVAYALIQLAEGNRASCIHLFATHMQASYTSKNDPLRTSSKYSSVRQKQLQAFAEFIDKKRSGNRFPVVLAGDFNVNARLGAEDPRKPYDSPEYLAMLSMLDAGGKRIRDLVKECNGGVHPITMGDVDANGEPRERVLTAGYDLRSQQRLDYIFYLPPIKTPEDPNPRSFAEPVPGTAKVAPFYVKGRKFTQLSDHYGVECQLQVSPLPLSASEAAALDRGSSLASLIASLCAPSEGTPSYF